MKAIVHTPIKNKLIKKQYWGKRERETEAVFETIN